MAIKSAKGLMQTRTFFSQKKFLLVSVFSSIMVVTVKIGGAK